jgi:hypothetical protein
MGLRTFGHAINWPLTMILTIDYVLWKIHSLPQEKTKAIHLYERDSRFDFLDGSLDVVVESSGTKPNLLDGAMKFTPRLPKLPRFTPEKT